MSQRADRLYEPQKKSIVPGIIAGGAVCGALGYGMFQFLQGKDSRAANRAMLWRVGLQAGGVIALIAIVNIWEGPMVQGWLHANDPPKYEDPDVPHPRRY